MKMRVQRNFYYSLADYIAESSDQDGSALCTFFVYVLVGTARIVPSHTVAERMVRNSPVG